ncbi:glycoside hydrolase family 2 protein [Sorangium sp. So ce1389]|uniref:glycoside hydrolase family 2 protein n=1 Tax=Sorangium sp. So ce1389 TaxID=3133336 RepID=UPI003F5F2C2F
MPRQHLAQIGIPGSVPPPADSGGGARGYPRPLLRREEWISLNGTWEFALDPRAEWCSPADARFDRTIEVPFAPETPRSGVGETGFYKACWYRRQVKVPESEASERLILHFGAVDYVARVWVDGSFAGEHEGGYTPFSLDITELARGRESVTIVVQAHDDPGDLAKPRGKQDWKLDPHSIWYPRTTGIWQTVWLERVPRMHIEYVRWTPNLERWEIAVEVRVANAPVEGARVGVRLRVGDVTIANDQYTVVAGEVHRRITLSDPGIDDFRNELLWCPERPTLIDADIVLYDQPGMTIDRVKSYTALRSVAVRGDRFLLNGRAYVLRMVLDQGYWNDTGITAPDDEALRRDVELTKQMGFNGARKHQKIEDPRYLYWADRLGLLVWEEMPSAYRHTRKSIERLARQWLEAIRRDISHPCIIAWVPFNESWGVPNLPDNPNERHYVQALYHLTRSMDYTRPVIGNDGWESVATDIIGIHDYDPSPERIARRYFAHDVVPKLLKRERPGGRALVLDPSVNHETAIVLSEFGGIAVAPTSSGDNGGTWGYSACRTSEEFAERYTKLMKVINSLELLAGFCYTQFADTYQEANGLLHADRTPKFPLQKMAAATQGIPFVGPNETPSTLSDGGLADMPALADMPGLVDMGAPR